MIPLLLLLLLLLNHKHGKLYISFSKINYDSKFFFATLWIELLIRSLFCYYQFIGNLIIKYCIILLLLYIEINVNMTRQLYYSYCYILTCMLLLLFSKVNPTFVIVLI